MYAFFCSCAVLLFLVSATGCQSSNSGSSLKADQIVFDVACNMSVLVSEKPIATGTFKNSGTDTIFTLTEPSDAKGFIYKDSNGNMEITLNGFTLDGAQSFLPKYSWFSQLVDVLRFSQEQPESLEQQGSGKFSGTTNQGTVFTLSARNKGTIEQITVNQFKIIFS